MDVRPPADSDPQYRRLNDAMHAAAQRLGLRDFEVTAHRDTPSALPVYAFSGARPDGTRVEGPIERDGALLAALRAHLFDAPLRSDVTAYVNDKLVATGAGTPDNRRQIRIQYGYGPPDIAPDPIAAPMDADPLYHDLNAAIHAAKKRNPISDLSVIAERETPGAEPTFTYIATRTSGKVERGAIKPGPIIDALRAQLAATPHAIAVHAHLDDGAVMDSKHRLHVMEAINVSFDYSEAQIAKWAAEAEARRPLTVEGALHVGARDGSSRSAAALRGMAAGVNRIVRFATAGMGREDAAAERARISSVVREGAADAAATTHAADSILSRTLNALGFRTSAEGATGGVTITSVPNNPGLVRGVLDSLAPQLQNTLIAIEFSARRLAGAIRNGRLSMQRPPEPAVPDATGPALAAAAPGEAASPERPAPGDMTGVVAVGGHQGESLSLAALTRLHRDLPQIEKQIGSHFDAEFAKWVTGEVRGAVREAFVARGSRPAHADRALAGLLYRLGFDAQPVTRKNIAAGVEITGAPNHRGVTEAIFGALAPYSRNGDFTVEFSEAEPLRASMKGGRLAQQAATPRIAAAAQHEAGIGA